jgi:HEPN domain-containing protein
VSEELKREVSRWLQYAEEDLQEAERLVGLPDVVPRHPAWLAQQAAEKAVKAVLVYEQIAFPRTHNMTTLVSLIPAEWRVRSVDADLERLTEYAVEARYPVDVPEIAEEEARLAVEDAARLVRTAATELREKL